MVVSEGFTVDDVLGQSIPTSFTPALEKSYGGDSPVYRGCYASRLVLGVTPKDDCVPVRKLSFDGISAVLAGDYILARIPIYEEIADPFSSRPKFFGRQNSFYIARELRHEECAIELRILSGDGAVLRTDRSVNYSHFLKNDQRMKSQ